MNNLPMFLRPKEAAEIFRVQPATLKNWANKGLIEVRLTPNGHRRYVTANLLEVMSR